jgi:DeoR/GlpR family transcriptional regulator of sugar metabolism
MRQPVQQPTHEPERQDQGARPALPARRRADLARFIQRSGQATVGELAEQFGVSLDTVRRDLEHLGERGVITRTHGGAVPNEELATAQLAMADRPFALRDNPEHKHAIGAAAAELIADGQTILVNGGTTTLEVIRALRNQRDLSVVTNNVQIPGALPPGVIRHCYLIGGRYEPDSMVTIGPVGFAGATGISADVAVIGVGGVDTRAGLSTTSLDEAGLIREMIDSASTVIVVADSSKFWRRSFAHICPLAAVATLVTDAAPDPELTEALIEADVEIIVAGTLGSGSTPATA